MYAKGGRARIPPGEAPEVSPYKTLHGAGGQQRRTRASKGPQLKVKVRTQRKKKEATATTVAKEERSGNGHNKKGGENSTEDPRGQTQTKEG